MRTSLKRYNAEVHSQSAIEGIMELITTHNLTADEIESIDVAIFWQANNIIGSGKEAGHKKDVFTKEQADHSIYYLLAVAILDREVTPKQFEEDRIQRADVQHLLQKISVHCKSNIKLLDTLTSRYPEEMRCAITISLKNGD